jgi:hypothetical protein
VPKPRVNLTRFQGVFAPNSKHRARVTRGRRNQLWEPYYLAMRPGGLSTTAACVALGRKLPLVCFALLKSGAAFNPVSRKTGCPLT